MINSIEEFKNDAMGKGKIHSRTDHEGTGGEYDYSSALSLTSSLDGVSGHRPSLGRFTPGKEGLCQFYWRLAETKFRTGRPWKSLTQTGIGSPDSPAHTE